MRAEPESRHVGGGTTSVSVPRHGVSFATRLADPGDRLALVDTDGRHVSYRELAERVDRVGDLLGRARRLVLIEADHSLDTVTTHLAALAGGHPVLLVPPGDEERTSQLVSRYRPDAVQLVGDGAADAEAPDGPVGPQLRVIDEASPERLHPDLALLMSTSGSTGSPKLVRLSRRNLESNAAAIAEYLELTEDDRGITSLPLHYCYGLSILHSHLHVGASVALTNTSVVDRCFWARFAEVGVTGLSGVPHTFDLLDRVGFDEMELPTLRYLTQAGGRLGPAEVRRHAELAAARGRRFYVMYGQTEATARMAYLPPELAASRPTAIGRPIPGGSLRIDATPGEAHGELVYSGPNVMLGYAESAEDLARGRTVDELRTGDLARRSEDGLFEIVGRASRFIKPFGVRVDLDGVESLLDRHGIAAVCTGDDEQLVVAWDRGAVEPDGVEVRAVVRRTIGLPPARVLTCSFDELPRLASGKPDHRSIIEEARRRAASEPTASDAGGAAPGAMTGPGVARRAFTEILGLARIEDSDTFASLGGDSLSYVEASLRLERELGFVPRDWHVTPVGRLDSLEPRRRRGTRQIWRRVETNVVLRAVAIVLVVGTHADAFFQQGGAHLLFALAGFNFARFQLGSDSAGGTRRRFASVARLVVPTVALVALATTIREGFAWSNLALIHNYVGTGGRWWYWYVEALVQVLLVLAVLLAVPAVRRAERARPFLFPLVALIPLLGFRYGVLPVGEWEIPMVVAHVIAWLFVLGWLAQRAATLPQRLLVTALVLVAVPGLFDSSSRNLVVGGGLLLAMWLPQIVVPAPLHLFAGTLAGSSLYIYLTHFFVVKELRDAQGPWTALAASLALGVGTWLVIERGRRWVVDPVRASIDRRWGTTVSWRTPDTTPST